MTDEFVPCAGSEQDVVFKKAHHAWRTGTQECSHCATCGSATPIYIGDDGKPKAWTHATLASMLKEAMTNVGEAFGG